MFLITACSSSQKTPEFEDYLATNIRSDGGKEFYHTVTMTNPGSTQCGKSSKNVSGGMRVSGGSSSNTYGSGGITVGGECNESATDRDRQNFPDTADSSS